MTIQPVRKIEGRELFTGYEDVREWPPIDWELIAMHEQIRCVAENNWLRRILYHTGARRRLTRAI